MKRLPLIIGVIVMALAAAVTGCGRSPRYDARLVRADSLMLDTPDSALAILEAVDTAGLATEGDRAYRDLLLTQARYRCYITATTDSAINRALDYYRRHSTEREKLTRAHIYKGAVMEELGHPDSAMLYYKHAEATADPADHFNLGYTNLRIAQLYQTYYTNDSNVVQRMKSASRYFTIIRDTNYLITTIGTQGAFVKIVGKDSALIFLDEAINLAKSYKSPKGLQYQSKMAGIYFYDRDYRRAKDLAMEIIRNQDREKCNENQFYYYAARSYLKLGLKDSAFWVFSIIPKPMKAVDSMNYFQTLAELSLSNNNFRSYSQYLTEAKAIDSRISESSRNSQLIQTELACESSQQETVLKKEANSHLAKILLLILSLLIVISFVAYLIISHNIKGYQCELDKARLELDLMIAEFKKRIGELESECRKNKKVIANNTKLLHELNRQKGKLESNQTDVDKHISTVVRHRIAALNELSEGIRVKTDINGNRKSVTIIKLIKELQDNKKILKVMPSESFWNNLKLSVDGEFQGIASFVEHHYPELTMREHHLFWLLCARIPTQIIKICLNLESDVTVSKYKRKLIQEKLGLGPKLEDCIDKYLHGEMGPNQHH